MNDNTTGILPAGSEVTIKDSEFCIKAESDFTDTKFHNICTGEVTVVPTGVVDYMLGIPLIVILATIAIGAVLFMIGGVINWFRY